MNAAKYLGVDRLAAEQLLYLLGITWGQNLVALKAAHALGGLALQQMAAVGLLMRDFASSGDLEALLGATVGLLLRHVDPLLVVRWFGL